MPETPRDGQWPPGLSVTVIAFTVLGGALADVCLALITLTPETGSTMHASGCGCGPERCDKGSRCATPPYRLTGP